MTIRKTMLLAFALVLLLSIVTLGAVACQNDNYNIILSKTHLELNVGDQVALTATVAPSNATVNTVTWQSLDESIATVDNTGCVTAVSSGVTVITATAGNKVAVCNVKVQEQASSIIEVQSIAVSPTSFELAKNATLALTATVTPSNATVSTVTWQSLDESIATVDNNGYVMAVSSGVTVITATVGNKVAVCQITVPGEQQATSIDKNVSFKTLTVSNNVANGTVGSQTDTFDFADEVVVGENITCKVYSDFSCTNEIASKSVNLLVGDNVFYLKVTNGSNGRLYMVTLRRLQLMTVSFDTCGAQSIPSVTVDEGTTIVLQDVEKDCYNFIGWYDGVEGFLYQRNEYKVEHDVTLEATFAPNSYTANLNPNGGSIAQDSVPVLYDNTFNLGVPEHPTYAFDGWYLGETAITDSFGQSKGAWKFTQDTEFVAHWRTDFHLITTTQGCNFAEIIGAENTVTAGSEVNLSAICPLGYELEGWYVNDELIGSNASLTYVMPAKNIILVAKFETQDIASNFTFNSNYSNFAITGLKDNTVTEITIPSYTTSISNEAFADCNLQTVTWLSNNVTMANSVFKGSSIETFVLDKSVTTLPKSIFYNCGGIGKVVYNGSIADWCSAEFASNPLKIADEFYVDGSAVTDLVIPSSVTAIGDGAFSNAKFLATVTIEAGVESIGDSAFSGSQIVSVTLPSSLKTIGPYAFSHCYLLSECNFSQGLQTIERYAFWQSGLSGEVVIPDSVTKIDDYAFAHCESITGLVIGGGLTEWGTRTFAFCENLESVTINEGVTEIGSFAFICCKKLESISLPSSLQIIKNGAFGLCYKLVSIQLNEGLKEIQASAFVHSGIIGIVIPASVESLSGNAFANKISDVYYKGTAEQWSQIDVDQGSTFSYTVYFYSDDEPELNDEGTAYDGNYWHYVDDEVVVWTKESND